MSFDPWAWVEDAGTPVSRPRLYRARGYTDGERIWVDRALTAAEARCTLTHEIVHILAGHREHQPPKEEWRVRAETARLLIPNAALIKDWWGDVWELADELHVTPEVIRDRVKVLERTGM